MSLGRGLSPPPTFVSPLRGSVSLSDTISMFAFRLSPSNFLFFTLGTFETLSEPTSIDAQEDESDVSGVHKAFDDSETFFAVNLENRTFDNAHQVSFRQNQRFMSLLVCIRSSSETKSDSH